MIPYAPTRDGLRLAVRLVPNAAADRVMGLVADEGGRTALKVAVRAAPREGAANAALLRFLARLLELPPRDVTLAQGAAQRRKLLHIAGDPAQLARRMAEILHPWLTHA